jgi:hypothetical protein
MTAETSSRKQSPSTSAQAGLAAQGVASKPATKSTLPGWVVKDHADPEQKIVRVVVSAGVEGAFAGGRDVDVMKKNLATNEMEKTKQYVTGRLYRGTNVIEISQAAAWDMAEEAFRSHNFYLIYDGKTADNRTVRVERREGMLNPISFTQDALGRIDTTGEGEDEALMGGDGKIIIKKGSLMAKKGHHAALEMDDGSGNAAVDGGFVAQSQEALNDLAAKNESLNQELETARLETAALQETVATQGAQLNQIIKMLEAQAKATKGA